MARRDIQQIAKKLQIPYLLHFTRVANLNTILRYGLYPRDRFDDIRVTPDVNDPYRYDGHLGATSLSIGFPNYRMFYRLRIDNPTIEWVVLSIKPKVLWTKDCAFSKHNAADRRISLQQLESLKTTTAFEEMFEEMDGMPSRTEENLRPYDPTDPQAEVLVFDVIEPDLMAGVAFETACARAPYQRLLDERRSIANKHYFSSRPYCRQKR